MERYQRFLWHNRPRRLVLFMRGAFTTIRYKTSCFSYSSLSLSLALALSLSLSLAAKQSRFLSSSSRCYKRHCRHGNAECPLFSASARRLALYRVRRRLWRQPEVRHQMRPINRFDVARPTTRNCDVTQKAIERADESKYDVLVADGGGTQRRRRTRCGRVRLL